MTVAQRATNPPRARVQPRRPQVGGKSSSTFRRAAHTRTTASGKRVAVSQSKPIAMTGQQVMDWGRQQLADWQAMRQPGPGRREFVRHKARTVAVGVGVTSAWVVGQTASGTVAVLVGVLAAVGSMLVATFFPKHLKRRMLEPKFWHTLRKSARKTRVSARKHVQRGRAVAAKTRARTKPRPRKARA